MGIERPVAVIGAPDTFSVPGIPGVMNTNLSAETAIRSGFDVLLSQPPRSRRAARDLLRLSEEAGVRVGFPRWLRRLVSVVPPHPLVSIVAPVHCGLDHLLDLALWISGSHGAQRMEAQEFGGERMLTIRGTGSQLLSIQTRLEATSVQVSLSGGTQTPTLDLWVEPEEGLRSETRRFAEGAPGAVLLEESMDVLSALERVGVLGR